MQALKGLVVGLGLLIVIGIVLLGYGFYVKFHGKDVTLFKDPADTAATVGEPPAVPSGAEAPPSRGFGEARIDLPEDCTVTEMRPVGQRLYLRTGPAGLCERVIIIDTASGGVLGTIVLRP